MVLTTVNLIIVVRTAALLLIGLCGHCIWRSSVVRLYAFGWTLYTGIWLVANSLSLCTTRQKIRSHIYSPSRILTSHPSTGATEDITCLNSRGECESEFFITRHSLLQSPHIMMSVSFVLSTRDVKLRTI